MDGDVSDYFRTRSTPELALHNALYITHSAGAKQGDVELSKLSGGELDTLFGVAFFCGRTQTAQHSLWRHFYQET